MNDGDDSNEATTQVTTYTSNSVGHTLTAATDGLNTGLIYKLRFRATNVIGNSEYSDTVRFALVDSPTPYEPVPNADQTSGS